MDYSCPIDTITNITKIIKCKSPHYNIILDEYSYICKTFNVKININFHTNNTMIFNLYGIELDVYKASVYIYEINKISMEVFPKANSNYIFRNTPLILSANKRANKHHKITENKNTVYYNAEEYNE